MGARIRRYVAHKNLPSLSLVRFMTDHTGDFKHAIDGVNTPEAQVADNDYAWASWSKRSPRAPIAIPRSSSPSRTTRRTGPTMSMPIAASRCAGPYVKQGAVVSTRYSTVNMLRTIEDVLGIEPLSLNDAYQRPMSDIFDLKQKTWSFTATPSPALLATQLPIPRKKADGGAQHFAFAHDAHYWAARTRGYDWSQEDKIDAAKFNRVLWVGLEGAKPYPISRDGRDLRSARPKAD
jgi:hypothetical protein